MVVRLRLCVERKLEVNNQKIGVRAFVQKETDKQAERQYNIKRNAWHTITYDQILTLSLLFGIAALSIDMFIRDLDIKKQ